MECRGMNSRAWVSDFDTMLCFKHIQFCFTHIVKLVQLLYIRLLGLWYACWIATFVLCKLCKHLPHHSTQHILGKIQVYFTICLVGNILPQEDSRKNDLFIFHKYITYKNARENHATLYANVTTIQQNTKVVDPWCNNSLIRSFYFLSKV